MFKKLLVANRGEIACRIIATAKKLGIATVAIYSEVDVAAPHVKAADEALCVGPAIATDSYLSIDNVIAAAQRVGADAIHPGYGFLSENADFCRACQAHGIAFVGPPASAIEMMGSKSQAKNIMARAGVPLVPGYHGEDQSSNKLKQEADKIGYPVLIKAVAGGGGKGMRVVESTADFNQALISAKREAASSFGDDSVLLEKYLQHPRHIEIQVFCDQQGNAVYLFERDCSLQRRHQKIIEEAPAPGMSQALREAMGAVAVTAAQAIQYVGAGTIEFLLAAETESDSKEGDGNGGFYFMEMNTRLQVEHPITEMITGVDLVEWQLSIAAGSCLPRTQQSLQISGHAIEARIYAENPENNFFPDTGRLSVVREPKLNEHVRIDSGIEAGNDISVYYDPMLAKLIVWGENREQAMTRLSEALGNYYIGGINTNIEFLRHCVNHVAFVRGEFSTSFIDDYAEVIFAEQKIIRDDCKYENLAMIGLFFMLSAEQRSSADPWSCLAHWRLNTELRSLAPFNYAGESISLNVECCANNAWRFYIDEKAVVISGSFSQGHLVVNFSDYRVSAQVLSLDEFSYTLLRPNGAFDFDEKHHEPDRIKDCDNDSVDAAEVIAPMNGRVIEVCVKEGDTVNKGDELLVMEAMKMEHSLKSPRDGTVEALRCREDQLVKGGEKLVQIILASG